MIFTGFRLFVKTSNGCISISCPTLPALNEAIKEYLTESEAKNGILDKLTDFKHGVKIDDHIETKWQNLSVCAYLA